MPKVERAIIMAAGIGKSNAPGDADNTETVG